LRSGGWFLERGRRAPTVSNGFHVEHGRGTAVGDPTIVCDRCDEIQNLRLGYAMNIPRSIVIIFRSFESQ
jgi:hypothetical protein